MGTTIDGLTALRTVLQQTVGAINSRYEFKLSDGSHLGESDFESQFISFLS